MQLNQIFSVYDRKAQYYLPIFTSRTADALRQFGEIVTQSDTPIAKYPADFDLCRLGDIDLDTGLITPVHPEPLINGLVALQLAQSERSRYAKVLSNPQVDIEEILAENP